MNRKAAVVGGVIVIGAVIVVGAVASGVVGSPPPETTYLTARAAVTDVRDTVSISGSIRPVDDYGLAFGADPVRAPFAAAGTVAGGTASTAGIAQAAASWTVETVNVEAGDTVSEGDVLAAADTEDAELALTVAKANLEAAQARLSLDEQPVSKTTRATAKLGVTQAQQQLSQARKAQSQTRSQGRLAISQATAALNDAKAKLAADEAAGAPPTVIEADKAAVTQASRALATARQQAAIANTRAANAVATARLGVRSAQLAYEGTTDVDTIAAVAADRAAVAQAEQAVADAERTLELATIRSPIDGIVSSVDIRPGDSASGIVVRVRSPAVEVSGSVTESDLPSVRPGQPAEVRIGALDAEVAGTVTSVDVAGATKGTGGVVSFPVVIGLASPPALVAPSMTADVDITTARADGVLAVPATAIGGEPGAYTVQVFEGPGRVRTVPVEVGLLTAELAQIMSGIDAGTEVVTGIATARDLVTTFPTGPGGAGSRQEPSSSGSAGSQP